MPLSGNLKELPFPEVLRLLRDRTGTLEIVDKMAGDHFSFCLSAAKLVSASERGQPIPDALVLHSVLQRLSDNHSASFDFEERGAEDLAGPLSIPIDRILLSALAAIRSPERYTDYLPHPDTRYRAGSETTPWLTEDLLAFWVNSERLFRSGISAREIAAALGIPLPQVLLDLFKLRLLGMIVPVRAEPSPLAPEPFGPALRSPELPTTPVRTSPLPPQPLPALSPEPIPPAPRPPPTATGPRFHPAKDAEGPSQPIGRRQGVLARIAAGLRGILEKMYE
ncbi:DUF4388 domain-containing protein [Methylacidimicrobium sp. B4]|uniref:DUF4388 domain-containing protein n=1 Tax=Methylacidimicrobium sp. B4 TaxID=2796139 RepID=UPI001A8FD5C7|nr:DUF4388 domain-containing protein [Methylacidimicrobium sp. B4]QSR84034.1 DUF4388 domain-containing protein [Methylacidimicrobium sp. B4]